MIAVVLFVVIVAAAVAVVLVKIVELVAAALAALAVVAGAIGSGLLAAVPAVLGIVVVLVVYTGPPRARRPRRRLAPAFLDTSGDRGQLLVGDGDREWVYGLLLEASRRGYLTVDDYGDRYAAVDQARSRVELVRLLEGLPPQMTGVDT